MEKEILKEFSLNLRMSKIESGPPLSTILGNLGLNSVKFCSDLSELIIELPFFLVLEVKVCIFIDKTYSFFLNEPSTSMLLRIIAQKIEIKFKGSGGIKSKLVYSIKLKDIYLVSFFKFGNIDKNSLKLVYGTLSSMKLNVIR